tara:strand:+ start:299 stop:433 length:135 start_codon:yes stop_codon:yes gene_type:complete
VFFLDLINQLKKEIENFNQTKDFQRIIGFLADLDVLLLMLPKFF